MLMEIDPPMNRPEDWRWEDASEDEPRDEFGDEEDGFCDADLPTRPLEIKGPIHSPPEILRALSMWTELDEDEFSDFDDEDFDDEFDDDFEEELEDEYEELEDDFGDEEEEQDEDLDEDLDADLEGDEEIDEDLPVDDELEELEED